MLSATRSADFVAETFHQMCMARPCLHLRVTEQPGDHGDAFAQGQRITETIILGNAPPSAANGAALLRASQLEERALISANSPGGMKSQLKVSG